MQNKDAKQGYPVYILDRKNISVKTGKITNSPMPHYDNHFPNAAKMVVDISVEVDGKVTTYVLDDAAEMGFVGDCVVTLNRECIQRELEAIKAQSEQALSMIDYHKKAVEKADELLKEYSPEYKERTEYASRIKGVEDKVDKLAETISAFLTQQKGGIR